MQIPRLRFAPLGMTIFPGGENRNAVARKSFWLSKRGTKSSSFVATKATNLRG